MMNVYEVALLDNRTLEVREYGQAGAGYTVVRNEKASSQAIKFALRGVTNEEGTRVLSQGESCVVRSIITAEQLQRKDQDAWVSAAASQASNDVSESNLADVVPLRRNP